MLTYRRNDPSGGLGHLGSTSTRTASLSSAFRLHRAGGCLAG
jgi:hypothetical protein